LTGGEPEISATASFPESNLFARTSPLPLPLSHSPRQPASDVVNGERNTLSLTIENKSSSNVTLTSIGGAFYDVETGQLVKNVRSPPHPEPEADVDLIVLV
jgi:hypothetical protein